MKYTTYSRYLPELADTINLQGLLDQLADFLLQSGFAGGAYSHPFWGEFGEDDADRSLDALRQAILQALMESGGRHPAVPGVAAPGRVGGFGDGLIAFLHHPSCVLCAPIAELWCGAAGSRPAARGRRP